MSRLTVLVFLVSSLVSLAPTCAQAQAACSYYASPQGGGTGLSPASAFHVADFWRVARPGLTLCLLDGTYTGGQNLLQVPPSFAGTASQPITIRALNDGKVLIDGGTSRPVDLRGVWGILEGINARGADNIAFSMRGQHWHAKRFVVWNNGANPNALLSMAGTNNTAEDCAVFGWTRKAIEAGASVTGPSGNTIRRCWARWETKGAPGGSGPTETLEVGYGQENVTAENNIVTRDVRPPGYVTEPEAPLKMFRGSGSALLGSIAYLAGHEAFDTGTLVDYYPDGGSSAQAGKARPTNNARLQDLVAIVHPSHPRFRTVRSYTIRATGTTPGTGNHANNIVGVSGMAGKCEGPGITCTHLRQGTSVANVLAGTGHNSLFTLVPGICKRYVNRTLTTTPLWPWPMNQRIQEALRHSGRAEVDITATMERLLGPIPETCRGASGGDAPPVQSTRPAPTNLRVLSAP